jgi:polyphosphate glucokinase
MALRTSSPANPSASKASGPVTLTIDVGGSGLKAMLVDAKGKPLSERQRIDTPAPSTVRAVLRCLDELARLLPGFDRVSVGFPGVIKGGATMLAVNLHRSWIGFPLESDLKARWHKPVRVGNDADIQGYGAVKGKGVEMVVTLGTGMGSALFIDGRLLPNLELGHHPWRKRTYEDYLGRRGLDKFGKKAWNVLLQQAIDQWLATFNWDHLYIGGGNTRKINFTLPEHVTIVSNELGLLGGVALWREL